MIAFFSALLGFISSAFPEFISLFREHKDRRHELTLLELQMQQARAQREENRHAAERDLLYKLEAVDSAYHTQETAALNERPDGVGPRKTGIFFVDVLSGSVRPLITYLFFALYASTKIAQYHLLTTPALPLIQPLSHHEAIVALWTENDMAVFTAIIAFWFGSRLFKKPRSV